MCEFLKRVFMAVRNFVLKLVQKGSGKRTHVTIEQKAGSGVEPSPNVEYTFEKVDNGGNSVDIRSFKRVDGGEEKAVEWSVGSVSGNGANLVTINKRRGGVDIKIGDNMSESDKNWSVVLTQSESGKGMEINGVVKGSKYVFRYVDDVRPHLPGEKIVDYLYAVESTRNESFMDYKMAVSGGGSSYIECSFLNRIRQKVDNDSAERMYLYIRKLENTTGKDLPYVITLTQDGSGKKLEFKGVVKKAGVAPGDDELERKLLIVKHIEDYTSPDGSCGLTLNPRTKRRGGLCTGFTIAGLKKGDTIKAEVRYQLVKGVNSNNEASCGLATRPAMEENWYNVTAEAKNVGIEIVKFGSVGPTPFEDLIVDTPVSDLMNILKVGYVRVKNKNGQDCKIDLKMLSGAGGIDPVW